MVSATLLMRVYREVDMKKLPEQKYLKECFDYIPENGHLIWKTRPAEHFKNI